MKPGATKEVKAHAFERQAEEHYVEPEWNDRALFRAEEFIGEVFDPCCGFGRVPLAAREMGLDGNGGDIVDRGFPHVEIADFLAPTFSRPTSNFVFNPPFSLIRPFIEKAVALADRKVASIMQCRRLNAAHWLRDLPLVKIWYLTPRPSMLPGHLILAGEKAEGGQHEFCWLVFERGRIPEPPGWLHRDHGALR